MIDINILITSGVWLFIILVLVFWIGIGIILAKFVNFKVALVYGIVMFLFILIFSICFCKHCKKELYKPRDPDLHEKLYNLMEYFDKFCQKHDIKYWAVAGTALGMIRNKGIIPHDDDLDVGMLQEDLDKLMSLKEKYENNLYYFVTEEIVRIKSKYKDQEIQLDIIVYKKDKDKYIPSSQQYLSNYPTEWFYEKELFPLRRFRFGKFKINGPKKPKKYLDRVFSNWHKIRIDLPHGNKTITDYLKLLYNRMGMFP